MIDSFIASIQRMSVLAADALVGAPPAGAGTAAPTEVAAGAAPIVGAAAEPGGITFVWWIVIYGGIFAAMYFFMFRPQRRKAKEMAETQAALKTGDNIVTSGGLFGKITDVGTDSFLVELGMGGKNVRIPILKSDVVGVREPVMTPPPKE